MMTRYVGALGIVSAVALLPAAEVRGCECITVPLKLRFMMSSDVFVGEFLTVTRGSYGPEYATLAVSERFLGARGDELKLVIAGGLCSTSNPAPGHEALIFAERSDAGEIVEIGCASRPTDRGGAASEIQLLRRRGWWWRLQRRVRAMFTRM